MWAGRVDHVMRRALALLPHLLVVVLILGCTRAPDAVTSTTPTSSTAATTPGGTGATTPPTDQIPPTHPQPPPPPPPGPTRGVAFSPKSAASEDFLPFFDEAAAAGRLVSWGGPVEQLADETSAPAVISTIAHDKGLRIVIQATPFRETGGGPTLDANLTASVAAFAAKHAPEYLALGIEVNRFAEKKPGRFEQFVSWYDATYDAVKNASATTKVFVTFQYEWMEGHRGGLFGGPENASDQWSLLARFPKRDLTAFTTYPGLILKDPDTAPASYYADLSRAGGPVAFTEVAHFADTPVAGWDSSPEKQARFASWFVARANQSKAEFMVWLHLHDQPDLPPAQAAFRHMGLVAPEGAKRPAYWAFTGLRPT